MQTNNNVPAFGALAILIVCLRYKPSMVQLSKDMSVATKAGKMDFFSVTVLISSLVCLLLALQWGGIVYKWSDTRVWGCLIGFAGLITVFAVLQVWRQEK